MADRTFEELHTATTALVNGVAAAAKAAGYDVSPNADRAGWLVQRRGAATPRGVLVLSNPGPPPLVPPNPDDLVHLIAQAGSGSAVGGHAPVPGLTYDLVTKHLGEAVALVMTEVRRLMGDASSVVIGGQHSKRYAVSRVTPGPNATHTHAGDPDFDDLADAIKWCVANSAGKPYGFAIVEKDAGGNWRAVKHVSNGIVSDTAP